MIKDMENGEIRAYKGKKYKYVEIEAIESDIDWSDICCKDCVFEKKCIQQQTIIDHFLGDCYEGYRKDGRNGIFVEVEEG